MCLEQMRVTREGLCVPAGGRPRPKMARMGDKGVAEGLQRGANPWEGLLAPLRSSH